MKDYTYVKNDSEMAEFRNYLFKNGIKLLAMDFEAESNLHAYGERLCLIQVFDGKRFFLIDPFGISRDELAKLLEEKRIVKYFYGCESDLSMAYKQYQIKVKSVLDLKNLVDVLGFEKKGLDAALSEVLQVAVADKKRYQMYNWTLRPIRKEALEYALTDVEHLFGLHEGLLKRIMQEGKYGELLRAVVQNRNEFDGKSVPTVFRSGEYQSLNGAEKALFQKAYDVRDAYAKEADLPPNAVISKECLFRLAKAEIGAKDVAFEKRIPEKLALRIRDSLTEALGR